MVEPASCRCPTEKYLKIRVEDFPDLNTPQVLSSTASFGTTFGVMNETRRLQTEA
jgi:hypothetical protein